MTGVSVPALQLSDANFAQRLRDFRYEITKQNAKFESECCTKTKVIVKSPFNLSDSVISELITLF